MTASCVRLAGAADLAALARLVGGMRDFLAQATPDDATIAIRLARLIGEPQTDFVLAEDSAGEPRGYLQQRYRESLWYGREAEVEDLYIAQSARGQGLGMGLVQFALGLAEQRGCSVLGLQTNENNAAAVSLYAAAGLDARRARWHGGRQIWLLRELPSAQGMVG